MALSERELLKVASEFVESPDFRENVIDAMKDDEIRERLGEEPRLINAGKLRRSS